MENQNDNSDHNHESGHGSSMMWMMIACCAVPILAILFLSGGIAAFGGTSLFLPLIALVLLVACVVMMIRHRKSSHSDVPHDSHVMDGEQSPKAEDHHDMKQDHSCCH